MLGGLRWQGVFRGLGSLSLDFEQEGAEGAEAKKGEGFLEALSLNRRAQRAQRGLELGGLELEQ